MESGHHTVSCPEHSMPPRNIAVLAFDQISPFHLSVPGLVFAERTGEGFPEFHLSLCRAEDTTNGYLRTTTGFDIATTLTLEDARHADVLVVPSWRDIDERPPQAMIDAVRDAHERGAIVVGLCLGAFVLAEAGILDGQAATTHWLGSASFSRRYPKVRLMPDILYAESDDGRIITSAGTAAGLDCCLHLVRRWHGAEQANRIARRLIVAPHRQGGQAQYIEQPVYAGHGTDRLSDLLGWLVAHLHETHSLDSLAGRAAMSRRNFTRRFRELTGTTVGLWLLDQRLALSQHLLESSRLGIEVIAQQAGFGSVVSLRQHFQRRFHTSPSAYRTVFAGNPLA